MRKVYHVVPKGSDWQLVHKGSVLSNHRRKEVAIVSGRKAAKANRLSQLVIHLANGRIQTEYTYGSDPYPPAG